MKMAVLCLQYLLSLIHISLPKSHPKYKAILKQYQTFVYSLIKYQSPDGFWHNVIDRSDSPKEVSGTAIFTMGIARGIRSVSYTHLVKDMIVLLYGLYH